MASSPPVPPALEAKLVVLGAQGVGKTSFVHRYVKNAFVPPEKAQSTVGASFLAARVHEPESGSTIRLQIWDTAGQERFRSISRLYYRGANAAILCYDVTSRRSFEEMGVWLNELRQNCGADENEADMIVHVVGTKTDIVAVEPERREVPFERCVDYVAEQLHGHTLSADVKAQLHASGSLPRGTRLVEHASANPGPLSPDSNRSSGFWGLESVWDCCHEISAKDNEGIDEVFRVITRKLVEQQARRAEQQRHVAFSQAGAGRPLGVNGHAPGGAQHGYFDYPGAGTGSFRVGHGDKRRSWLGALATPGGLSSFGGTANGEDGGDESTVSRRCC